MLSRLPENYITSKEERHSQSLQRSPTTMLVHPPLVGSCPVSRDLLVHSNPNAVNSVRIVLVEIPSRGRGSSRICRSRCRSRSSATQVERLVVGGGGAKKRHDDLRYRASPISISAAEVEGSSDVDVISTYSHIPAAALEVETVVLESASASASALFSGDAEAAAQDGDWHSLGKDGGVEHLSTSSFRNGLGAFSNNLGTVNSGTEFEAIQSTEWPGDHEDTAAEGQERNAEGLNGRNGNVPYPEFYDDATEEEEEDVGAHTDEQLIEYQKMSSRGSLGVRKPSQDPSARSDPAPWKSQVDNIAQRLEPPKTASSKPEPEEEFEYYIPKVGDYVTGVVVSGNENQLDLDIGAKQLGLMLAKDVKPLDPFRPDEFFWEMDESGTSMPATSLGQVRFLGDKEPLERTHPLLPVGMVLTMQVYGVTFSGKPLLSARKVASRIAWQRVQQIHERDEPIEAQCMAWNSDGLVLNIEGLRAVLPLKEFLNRSSGSGSLKEHVGDWKQVLITDVDEASGKVPVSEKRAWAWRHLQVGSLVNGTVQRILPFGVEIILSGTSLRAMLHISNISQCFIPDIKSIFTAGEKVKALVTDFGKPHRIGLSTAPLERSKGLMLEDKERVYQEAEEMAAWHRSYLPTKEDNEDDTDVDTHRKFEEPCPANQDWLDLGEGKVPVLDPSHNKQ